ncbi:MAG: hypothetical protein IJA77_10105 [Clostridia bacterium]|nr:hypothetical protein [Clostridia bacterium]
MEDRIIKTDRMRYTKNTASSRLALLAIVFDVLYFVSIYQSDVGSHYYTILIGASVVYNLLFMLMAFLSSEGVKNYKTGYSWLLMVLGVIQVGRIFILPLQAFQATVKIKKEVLPVMGQAQFTYVVICLVLSCVCCIASAVINLIKSRRLQKHIASLDADAA